MRLPRSESLVLRKIMESEEKGLSYKELSRTLKGELSNQGLSDALKGLQLKSLVHRDFMGRTRGSHAMYRSTATTLGALYTNEMADFIASRDVVTEGIDPPTQLLDTPSSYPFYPSFTMIRSPGEAFAALEEKENLGKKLSDAAEYMISVWLASRQKRYNENSLEVVKEYEDAYGRYLWLFGCQMKKWAPGAVNEPLKKGPYTFVDPLSSVLGRGNLDWPLEKYQITEEEHQRNRKNFPWVDNELGPMSVEELRKIKAVVYNKKKREMYEAYLRFLMPPKTVVLIDFGLRPTTGQKRSGPGKGWSTSGREEVTGSPRPKPQVSSLTDPGRPGIVITTGDESI